MNGSSDFYKTYHFLKEFIHVNCFGRLRFLAEVDNLWTIIQEGNMETRQMTPFFHLTCPF